MNRSFAYELSRRCAKAMSVWKDEKINGKNLKTFVYNHSVDIAKLAQIIAENEFSEAKNINHAIKGRLVIWLYLLAKYRSRF